MHPERSTTLIVSGAYQASRNPIYLGMIGGVVAHGLWRGSMRALLPAVGVTLWLDRLQTPAEEEALDPLYGEASGLFGVIRRTPCRGTRNSGIQPGA